MSLSWFSAPFGATPFGVGTPSAAPIPPTGTPSLCRYIDPVSKDFQIDPATGQLAQMPPVRQRFLLLLSTILGSSSALPNLGIGLPVLIDDSFARRVDVSVRVGARQMTEIERVARINDVSVVTTAGGRVVVFVDYTDLTTGLDDRVSRAIG